MKSLFTFVVGLIAASTSYADLELHSVRCSTRNLTLDIAMVGNDGPVEASNPNAKGVLVFKARNQDGVKLLNGRPQLAKSAYFSIEHWPKGSSLRAYSNGPLNLYLRTKDQLEADLSKQKPLLYFYIGEPENLSAKVSYVEGRKIQWSNCEFEFDDDMEIKTEHSITSFPNSLLQRAATCPSSGSQTEKDMIFEKGPVFVREGKMDFCLNKSMNRMLSLRGKSTRSMSKETLKDEVQNLMTSIVKSESFEF